jgi:hypothetical protein
MLLPSTVTKSVTSREMSITLDARDTKLDSERDLTKPNLLLCSAVRKRKAQTVLFRSVQGQNKPRCAIGAGRLRSRSLHVDLHAELQHIENSLPADSAAYFARLARFSFNWLDPPPKNLKSSYSPRHKSPLLGDTER